MHGGGFWLVFSALLSGHLRRADPRHRVRSRLRHAGRGRGAGQRRDDHRRCVRPPDRRPARQPSVPTSTTSRRLLIYGSGGAILSPSVKDGLARVLPTTIVHDGFGASETGGQGRLVGTGDDGAPRFDDGRDQRGHRRRRHAVPARRRADRACSRPAATSRSATTRTTAKTAATFPVIDGVRYAVPGDLASVRRRRLDRRVRPRVGVDQLRRREDLPRGGREGAQEPSGGVRRHRGRHPQRALRRRRSPPWSSCGPGHADDPPDLADLQEHCREHLAGYKVPRAVVFVDATVRSPSGKPDYRWAKEAALAGLESPAIT